MAQHPKFTAALLDPAAPAPAGLVGPDGGAAGKRFNVYRNNVAVSLTEALAQGFPAVERLVGDAFFKAMAGVFLRQHPPKSPVMLRYGTEMPGFLAAFPPVAHLPYLPDVARLDLARRESYHAADAAPMPPDRLQTLTPDALMAIRLPLAPAVRVVRSAHPVLAIWHKAMDPAAPAPQARPEDVLITRPAFDPVMTVLPAGGAAFVATLADGHTLGAAVAAAGDGFDLTTTLGALITGAALTSSPNDPNDPKDPI